MENLSFILSVALDLLILLIIIILFKKQPTDFVSKIESSLKEQFINFQNFIHNELDSTKKEVSEMKDNIYEQRAKTLEYLNKLNDELNKITTQQEEVQKIGQKLQDLLQPPKLRGSFGEVILEELLDKVLPKGIWERQFPIDNQEKVDAVIKFKDIIIPIDAKFPRDDYFRYLNEQNEKEKSTCWKKFENAVMNQIKSIKDKYIKPEKGTSDFAIMFIPSETIYYETIAEKNYLGENSKIFEYAQENRVIPVGPNTFYIFLQVIAIGIRNIEIMKSAKKLQENLSLLQKYFSEFYSNYEKIGDNLKKAVESYNLGDRNIQKYKSQLDNIIELEELNEINVINVENLIENDR